MSSATCGTVNGYEAHRRRGEATCSACKRAMADRRQERRTTAKGLPVVDRSTAPTVQVEIRCPKCGGAVESQNTTKKRAELILVVACQSSRCGCLYLCRLIVVPAHPDELGDPTRCGTSAGYQRHVRAEEQPCRACVAAHAENHAKSKRRRAGK